MAKAGGLKWNKENKINVLKQAIYLNFKKVYIFIIMLINYNGYINYVLGTAARIKAANSLLRPCNRTTPVAAALNFNKMD